MGISIIPALNTRLKFNKLSDKDRQKKIWIHAASVGEVRGIYSLVNKILEEVKAEDLIFTTTSESGKKELLRLLPRIEVVLAPFDAPRIIRKFLKIYQPKLLVINETELWPGMLFESNKFGLACVLVNGRISDRSFNTYKIFRVFFTRVLDNFQKIFAQTELDKSRFEAIGAKKELVEVAGLTKFDFPLSESSIEFDTWWQKCQIELGFNDTTFVVAMGSVREEEEKEIIECVKEVLRLNNKSRLQPVFIVAPRHPDRFAEIGKLFSEAGILVSRKSYKEEIKLSNVIILDTIGELLNAYFCADICFVGGTFSAVGGHNVLEPAYFGKPIFVGPNTQNTRDAASALEESGALIRVKSGVELGSKIFDLVLDLNRLVVMGDASYRVFEKIKGATDRIYIGMKKLGVFNFLFLILVVFSQSACSPTKGYSGPELPETELSLVYYKDCDSHVKKVRASSEGVEFDSSGISLLPGKHLLDSFVEVPYKPYDCVAEFKFDQSGYDSCLSSREYAISKSKKYIPECYVSSYQKTVYWCSQNFRQFLCSTPVDLKKGQKYDLCVTHLSGVVKARISLNVSSGATTDFLTEVECGFTNEEIRRLEFSESY